MARSRKMVDGRSWFVTYPASAGIEAFATYSKYINICPTVVDEDTNSSWTDKLLVMLKVVKHLLVNYG
ncbi:MAG: hypothetical protein V4456_14605 [Bacteroidota bacterium]